MSAEREGTQSSPGAQASALINKVRSRLGSLVAAHGAFRGDDTIHVARESIVEAARQLKGSPELAFDLLVDVTAVDYFGEPDGFSVRPEVWDRNRTPVRRLPPSRHQVNVPPRGALPRFAVVYHLFSTTLHHRLRIKCRVPEDDPTIASLTPVWKGADWLERETYDMYGIRFVGHSDLRRIYLYEEFQGYPLRKDYDKRAEQPIEEYAGPGAKEPRRPE